MAITLTIVAPGPEHIADVWDSLKRDSPRPADIDIVGEEMFIAVDLTPADEQPAVNGPEPDDSGTDPVDDDDASEDDDPAANLEEADPEPVPDATDDTCEAAIIRFLEDHDGVSWSPAEIVEGVPQYKESTVRYTLGQLAREDKIARASRGQYEAL